MIRIDLLPDEYRRTERTEPTLFFASLGLLVFFLATLSVAAYFWFAVVGQARSDVQVAHEILDSKRPMSLYADQLETEKKEYTSRLDHIHDFSNSRVLWTKKIDQLTSLIDSPLQDGRHQVWLQLLKVDMNDTRGRGMLLTGHSATSRLKNLSDFNTDLKTTPFFNEFQSISVPAGKVVVDDDYEPSAAWEFEASLNLGEDSPPKKGGSGK